MSPKWASAAVLGIGFQIAASAPSYAQSSPAIPVPGDPREPVAFEAAYASSFNRFDACDDSEAGQIYRRAVIEQFEACKFPHDVNEKFRDWLIKTLEDLATAGWKAAAERQDITPTPDYLSAGTYVTTCKAYRETPKYVEQRAKLLKYSQGESGVDAVVEHYCSLGPIGGL